MPRQGNRDTLERLLTAELGKPDTEPSVIIILGLSPHTRPFALIGAEHVKTVDAMHASPAAYEQAVTSLVEEVTRANKPFTDFILQFSASHAAEFNDNNIMAFMLIVYRLIELANGPLPHFRTDLADAAEALFVQYKKRLKKSIENVRKTDPHFVDFLSQCVSSDKEGTTFLQTLGLMVYHLLHRTITGE